jgi:nucleoside-diphosphate-sugar epimerase
MINRALLTGASGFIGGRCITALQDAGYEVHAVGWEHIPHSPNSAIWHQIDLLDAASITTLLQRIKASHLLHLAWYAVPGKYSSSLENLRWSQATLALLQGFAECGGGRAVFAGSCFEYDLSYGYCTEDLTPSRAATLYGVCKNATREIVAGFSKQTGFSTAWGRIFYLYGPHETGNRLVPSIVRSLLKGDRARLSHGRQVRDFLHVEDVARAFVALLKSEVSGTVNVGSGEPVTIRDVACYLAARLERSGFLDFGAIQPPATDPPVVLANISRLRDQVGWRPKWTLQAGLAATADWWSERASKIVPD